MPICLHSAVSNSRRLSLAGGPIRKIGAVVAATVGHRALGDVTRYTDAAERGQLAAKAMVKAAKEASSAKPG